MAGDAGEGALGSDQSERMTTVFMVARVRGSDMTASWLNREYSATLQAVASGPITSMNARSLGLPPLRSRSSAPA